MMSLLILKTNLDSDDLLTIVVKITGTSAKGPTNLILSRRGFLGKHLKYKPVFSNYNLCVSYMKSCLQVLSYSVNMMIH